jgi:ribose 5-phosphate isomerase B
MKIHLATDHAGFTHKESVKEYLAHQGFEIIDHGAFMINEEDDYPDYMKLAAEAVAKDSNDAGIIFGYSGEGEAMVANRYPAIRAAVYNGGSREIVRLSREHNNANILSIGAHFISIDETIQAVALWLTTPFSQDARHIRRLGKF